jgi:hypothetical protein
MLVGDADPTIPADQVAAVEAAAQQAGIDLRVVVFAGGTRISLRRSARTVCADAAGRAWQDTIEFLAQALRREMSVSGSRTSLDAPMYRLSVRACAILPAAVSATAVRDRRPLKDSRPTTMHFGNYRCQATAALIGVFRG